MQKNGAEKEKSAVLFPASTSISIDCINRNFSADYLELSQNLPIFVNQYQRKCRCLKKNGAEIIHFPETW